MTPIPRWMPAAMWACLLINLAFFAYYLIWEEQFKLNSLVAFLFLAWAIRVQRRLQRRLDEKQKSNPNNNSIWTINNFPLN